MTTPNPRHAELEQLFTALESGTLDEAQQRRLGRMLDDDEMLDAAVDQLEVEALLRWHHGAVSGAGHQVARVPAARTSHLRVAAVAAAAILLVGIGVFWFWPNGTDNIRSGDAQRVVALTTGWEIRATGNATFKIIGQRVRLHRGELFVRSTRTPADPLSIETPLGEARATGTEFFVGTHTNHRESKTVNTPTQLTRVLVLSGTVTLTNALGAATAKAGELIAAPQGGPPTQVVAQSGGDFGFDLYRKLAATRKGKNLFFSPYSITNVLTMAAEGARGQTAEEMGKVLTAQRTASSAVGNSASTLSPGESTTRPRCCRTSTAICSR